MLSVQVSGTESRAFIASPGRRQSVSGRAITQCRSHPVVGVVLIACTFPQGAQRRKSILVSSSERHYVDSFA